MGFNDSGDGFLHLPIPNFRVRLAMNPRPAVLKFYIKHESKSTPHGDSIASRYANRPPEQINQTKLNNVISTVEYKSKNNWKTLGSTLSILWLLGTFIIVLLLSSRAHCFFTLDSAGNQEIGGQTTFSFLPFHENDVPYGVFRANRIKSASNTCTLEIFRIILLR